jgi:hypothetical protein
MLNNGPKRLNRLFRPAFVLNVITKLVGLKRETCQEHFQNMMD